MSDTASNADSDTNHNASSNSYTRIQHPREVFATLTAIQQQLAATFSRLERDYDILLLPTKLNLCNDGYAIHRFILHATLAPQRGTPLPEIGMKWIADLREAGMMLQVIEGRARRNEYDHLDALFCVVEDSQKMAVKRLQWLEDAMIALQRVDVEERQWDAVSPDLLAKELRIREMRERWGEVFTLLEEERDLKAAIEMVVMAGVAAEGGRQGPRPGPSYEERVPRYEGWGAGGSAQEDWMPRAAPDEARRGPGPMYEERVPRYDAWGSEPTAERPGMPRPRYDGRVPRQNRPSGAPGEERQDAQPRYEERRPRFTESGPEASPEGGRGRPRRRHEERMPRYGDWGFDFGF